MGRWGDGIYDSDWALDYFGKVTDQIERELFVWLTPNLPIVVWRQDFAGLLSLLEISLLLDQHLPIGSGFLSNLEEIPNWRNTIQKIWDGDWEEKAVLPALYNSPESRQKYRPAMMAILDRIDSIIALWNFPGNISEAPPLKPLHPDYPLPFFSVRRRVDENKEFVYIDRFTSDLLVWLLKEIIYYLSPEKRFEMVRSNVETGWVAADLLAYLCAAYEQSPGIKEEAVRNWRAATIDILKQFLHDDHLELDESDGLYREVLSVFDRLEAVAKKYPPVEW
jgi:hypothetical protein